MTVTSHASGAGDNRCYIYGIVPADVEPTPDAVGVGDPPGRVEAIRHGKIAALVSEIDASKQLGSPEDLTAHQRLLDAAAKDAPVLPVRFGAAMTSPDAVAEELLAPAHDEFAAALGELEGRAEYVVRGRYVEDTVLREVLSENSEAASLRDEIRAAGDEDATRDLRIRLGEIVNEAVTAKREADTRALGDGLAPHCVASKVREPIHEDDAANIAVLAETGKQADLEEALSEVARDWEGRVELRLLGPMAPYDFVATPVPEG